MHYRARDKQEAREEDDGSKCSAHARGLMRRPQLSLSLVSNGDGV